jgi:FMNH2-dependent dimethyl sulfone monooxygenase
MPATDRLREGNALKFGVFGVNVSHGCSVTSAPGNIEVNWDESVRIARAADATGIEALIPVARWKGFGGETNFNHRCFETYTWAAGLAQATENIHVLATSHVPTIHPVMAAKQAATIDHISGGRFGLNIVAGWNASEIGMFGRQQREHDERYAVAGEWITIIKRLWTESGGFDFKGEYFDCPAAYAEPKPVQQPHPFIISAGASPAGQRFAAEHADMNFILAPTLELGAGILRDVKAMAKAEFGRDIQVWGMAAITQGETQKQAEDYFTYYVDEVGDWTGAENMLNAFAPNSGSYSPEHRAEHLRSMVAGYCAWPIVGSAERIAESLIEISNLGFDGLSLSWVNYDDGLAQFNAEVMPLLEQAGVRQAITNPTT